MEPVLIPSTGLRTGFGMTIDLRLLRGVYTEHFDSLSAGSVNVLAMTTHLTILLLQPRFFRLLKDYSISPGLI